MESKWLGVANSCSKTATCYRAAAQSKQRVELKGKLPFCRCGRWRRRCLGLCGVQWGVEPLPLHRSKTGNAGYMLQSVCMHACVETSRSETAAAHWHTAGTLLSTNHLEVCGILNVILSPHSSIYDVMLIPSRVAAAQFRDAATPRSAQPNLDALAPGGRPCPLLGNVAAHCSCLLV